MNAGGINRSNPLGLPVGGSFPFPEGGEGQRFQNGVLVSDQHGVRQLARPTLVLITPGFALYPGATSDWIDSLAEEVKDQLWRQGSSAVVWKNFWNSRDPMADGGGIDYLIEEVRKFLSNATETWDLFVIGHSRGAV